MSLMQDQIEALQQAIAEAEKPKMRRATRKEKIVNPGVYKVPVHASDISQEPVDETAKDRHEFEEMVKKGTKAWAGTPDNWVDDLRGGVEKQDPDDDIYDVWVEQEIKEKNVPQS